MLFRAASAGPPGFRAFRIRKSQTRKIISPLERELGAQAAQFRRTPSNAGERRFETGRSSG